MTLLWFKTSSMATCGLLILFSLSPASSKLDLERSGKPKIILVTNKPFEFQCTATGTPSELAGATIRWEGPDYKPIPGNDDKYGSITLEYGAGSVTSILRVSKPPGFSGNQPGLRFYTCTLEAKQLNYHVYFVEEKAVPKIQLDQTKFKETVHLKCYATYENENFAIADKFSVILQWIKSGKILAHKSFEYKSGNNTLTFKHSLTVNSFRDGGDYVCQSQLMLQDKTDSVSSSKKVELQILPYLNGPIEKEVKDTLGSDVLLHCDVVGYPVIYQWRDEEYCLIGVGKNCTDPRIRQKNNILHIDDFGYKDQKRYTCVGSVGGNQSLKQIIILTAQGTRAQSRLTTILLICMCTRFLQWL